MDIKKILKSFLMLTIIILVGYMVLTYIYESTRKDKFNDILLNDVMRGDDVNSDILTYYNCYFNKPTITNLQIGSNDANTNYVNNSEKIAMKSNELSENINTLMIQLNNDILKNIGENYRRAHLLNRQREEMKKQLNDLPLKNI